MGAGSTIAAAISLQYESIGVESDPTFFQVALEAIPKLADLNGNGKANSKRDTGNGEPKQHKLALFNES
jgi:DNA modification methylase